MKLIPNFAVLEGGDCSGTTTQINLLKERLSQTKIPFFLTFEPTDGQIGELIRRALKKETVIKPETLAMLFASDRNEHIYSENGILERAKRGELVISDRYALSSLVYQGIDCGNELPFLLNLRFPAPQTLVYLDIDSAIAMQRLKSRSAIEIFENHDFQVKVREKYNSLLGIYRDAGVHVEIIDASKTAKEVHDCIWSVIKEMPIIKSSENTL
jgi:dTMP kinase